jgi:hypothetical protein
VGQVRHCLAFFEAVAQRKIIYQCVLLSVAQSKNAIVNPPPNLEMIVSRERAAIFLKPKNAAVICYYFFLFLSFAQPQGSNCLVLFNV